MRRKFTFKPAKVEETHGNIMEQEFVCDDHTMHWNSNDGIARLKVTACVTGVKNPGGGWLAMTAGEYPRSGRGFKETMITLDRDAVVQLRALCNHALKRKN